MMGVSSGGTNPTPTDAAELDLAGQLATLDLPFCPSYLQQGIRHLQRNCEVECGLHGDDATADCGEPGRYDGEAMANVLNSVPALVAELASARRQIAAAAQHARSLSTVCRYHGADTERLMWGQPEACCDTGREPWLNGKLLRALGVER